MVTDNLRILVALLDIAISNGDKQTALRYYNAVGEALRKLETDLGRMK